LGLRLRFEIACIMAFVQLLNGIARGAVDHPPPLDGGLLRDRLCPAHDVDVLLPLQELAGIVRCALRLAAISRPDRHVGDRILVAGHILRSSSAGIFEFGFTSTKPLPNCSPLWMSIIQASYSAPLWPRASSSSSSTVTFTPLGVPRE
jgi:hypothetical protein